MRAQLRTERGKEEKYTPVFSPLTKPQAVNIGQDVLCAERKKEKHSTHFMFIHVNVQSN